LKNNQKGYRRTLKICNNKYIRENLRRKMLLICIAMALSLSSIEKITLSVKASRFKKSGGMEEYKSFRNYH
jgi:hypothetical protein